MISDGLADLQPYTIEEFGGGVTDYPIDGPRDGAATHENLLLTPARKLTPRPGISYFVDSQINSSATRLFLINHFEIPLAFQARTAWYQSSPTTWAQIFGPNNGGATDASISDTGVNSSSILSSAFWKGHTLLTTDDISQPEKLYIDGSGNWQTRTAGLPIPPSLSFVSSAAGTAHNYVYALVYMYSYTVAGETFETRSHPLYLAASSTSVIGTDTITLTLPQFTGFGLNYDTANIKQELYRTIDNGQDLFLVTTQAYNAPSYADTMVDATLLIQKACYVNGGVLETDLPPKCKYVHVMGDTAYYGYLKDSKGTYAYQLRQSIPGNIDGVPGSFNLDHREYITGISSHVGKPILMGTNIVSRIEGSFDQFGNGSMQAVQISPNAGCISHNSIVQTPLGIVWFGNDGIYHTEGYVVHKLTPHLDVTYKTLTSTANRKKRITGTYHADLQCVVWSVCRTNGSDEPDSLLVLDLRWGLRFGALDVKQTTATFYWWSATTFSCPRWINRQLLLGTSDGFVHHLTASTTYDIKFGSVGSPSTWNEIAVLWKWTSCATDFGTKVAKKWVPYMAVDCMSTSNISMSITSIVDNGKRVVALKPVRFRGDIIWGITAVFWGDSGWIWGASGAVDAKRRMAKNSLRCMYRQIQIANTRVAILDSDLMGTVTVNKGALSAVLNGTLTFPSQFTDYVIAFSDDNYFAEFTIKTVSTNTVLFTDPNNLCPISGAYSFVVRGIPKNEAPQVNAVQMWWMPISRTLDAFSQSETGEPAT